ncbi:chymotrypsin-1-like [Belonocnema kinseyi]|uniref:chymotrypsin-1-like n=1 Tax=Belonocnema kinseyi TaxID=2817044 RepID=UPI00143E0044|nr:chymotrypsin-1-like [Belonocnema kinseyi]XP_033219085.1 chymotrypsin-1-like [Belonocnema kinseyi]XP_033219094.1 chymotrypsin-1-like [Belonocnema kinseyi]XP_033219104.1 chymotrypsin-1-like [Belonocnema kinseyi]
MRNQGFRHNITKRLLTSASGLAIFKIIPPINFHQDGNAKIELFTGVLPPNPFGRFSGWGCTGRWRRGRNIYPKQLMITRLPIISEQDCRHATPNPVRRICTLDTSRRRGTCTGDEGGPLVSIRNNQLIGVLLFSSFEVGIYPDIFVNLIEPFEQQWVTYNMNILRN